MRKNLNKFRAFTLIEVVIAVTLMSLVLVAIAGLIVTTMTANRRNMQSVQAVYLAQEGIEVMRYIRDSNWVQNYAWNEGINEWGDNFKLGTLDDEKVLNLEADSQCPPCWGFSINDEVITFENGQEFTRSVTIKPVIEEDGTEMEGINEIVIRMDWMDRTQERSYELSTYLSDWK